MRKHGESTRILHLQYKTLFTTYSYLVKYVRIKEAARQPLPHFRLHNGLARERLGDLNLIRDMLEDDLFESSADECEKKNEYPWDDESGRTKAWNG